MHSFNVSEGQQDLKILSTEKTDEYYSFVGISTQKILLSWPQIKMLRDTSQRMFCAMCVKDFM